MRNIEQLHVFAVTQHAEMIWREIAGEFDDDCLTDETITEAVSLLKRR